MSSRHLSNGIAILIANRNLHLTKLASCTMRSCFTDLPAWSSRPAEVPQRISLHDSCDCGRASHTRRSHPASSCGSHSLADSTGFSIGFTHETPKHVSLTRAQRAPSKPHARAAGQAEEDSCRPSSSDAQAARVPLTNVVRTQCCRTRRGKLEHQRRGKES